MTNDKHYYIKPRGNTAISYRRSLDIPTNPEEVVPAKEQRYLTRDQAVHAVHAPAAVLNMDFSRSHSGAAAIHRPSVAISFSRLAISTFVIAAMYLGGFAIYAQANELKSDITGLATKGVTKLELGATALSNKDFVAASNNFTAAENLFSQANRELLDLGQTNLYLSGLSGNNFKIITGTRLVDAGLNLAQAGKSMIGAMTPTFQYFNALGTQPVSAEEIPAQVVSLLNTARPQLDRAIGKVTRANSLLSDIDPTRIDPSYQQAISEAQLKTAALQQAVSVLGTLAQELPDALGFNNPRKYLVLNQNSNELRATGGFIGSFSILTVYKGKIDKMFVDITQRVDGQNPRPKLELPAPLRSVAYTGTFGTRDSNWYADFPTSARTFQELYEQAGGGTVDGIIGANPTLIENLLAITGPIDLPEKKVTISAENFVETTQLYAEVIDNSKQNPKQILSELAPIMLDRIMHLDSPSLAKVNQLLMTLLNGKELLLYSRNPKIEKVLTTLNFAGSLPFTDPNTDFLAVVRSNLGARKSSGSIASEISHTVMVNLAQELNTTLKLTYTHQGSEANFDGINKDYVRIYVPKGSRLIGVDGADPNTKPEVLEESDRTVFGIWVTTELQQTRTVTINYQPNVKLGNGYDLYIFKQSGDRSWLTSTLKASAAVGLDEDLDTKSKQLFDGKLDADQIFSVPLAVE